MSSYTVSAAAAGLNDDEIDRITGVPGIDHRDSRPYARRYLVSRSTWPVTADLLCRRAVLIRLGHEHLMHVVERAPDNDYISVMPSAAILSFIETVAHYLLAGYRVKVLVVAFDQSKFNSNLMWFRVLSILSLFPAVAPLLGGLDMVTQYECEEVAGEYYTRYVAMKKQFAGRIEECVRSAEVGVGSTRLSSFSFDVEVSMFMVAALCGAAVLVPHYDDELMVLLADVLVAVEMQYVPVAFYTGMVSNIPHKDPQMREKIARSMYEQRDAYRTAPQDTRAALAVSMSNSFRYLLTVYREDVWEPLEPVEYLRHLVAVEDGMFGDDFADKYPDVVVTSIYAAMLIDKTFVRGAADIGASDEFGEYYKMLSDAVTATLFDVATGRSPSKNPLVLVEEHLDGLLYQVTKKIGVHIAYCVSCQQEALATNARVRAAAEVGTMTVIGNPQCEMCFGSGGLARMSLYTMIVTSRLPWSNDVEDLANTVAAAYIVRDFRYLDRLEAMSQEARAFIKTYHEVTGINSLVTCADHTTDARTLIEQNIKGAKRKALLAKARARRVNHD
jgi:hypothetical protein